MTSPTPGTTLTGSSQTFSWTAGNGVTLYSLHVGTTGAGSYNVFGGTVTGQSQGVSGIPATAATLYVRLYSLINGVWQYNDYTYTEEYTLPAAMISPVPGSTLASSAPVFSWTAGVQVTEYCLAMRTAGSYWWNLSTYCGTAQSQTVSWIPSTGGTINVWLGSLINGVWQSNTYNYTEPSFANMSSPVPYTNLTGPTVLFSWTAGLLAEQYSLDVGTTGAGSRDIFGGLVSGLSKSVTGIPANGELVYVRLSTLVNGVWNYNDYIYNNFAMMLSPTPGSTLAGSTVNFSWSSGTGMNFYYLQVGTMGPGSTDIYYQGVNSQGQSVTGIPITGGTLYVCLISQTTSYWGQTNCYTYTEARPAPAVMTSPASGSTLTGSTQTFTWTTGVGVTSYDLHVGTTGAGSSNIFAGAVTGQSQSVTGIPTTSGTLYVRLYSLISGAWQYSDYTYTEQ
jgi:hypothetical protein